MNEEKLFENKTTLNKSILLGGVKLWIKSFKVIRILIYALIFVNIYFAVLNFSAKEYVGGFIHLFNIVLFLLLPQILTFVLSKKQKYTFGLEKIYSVYNDRLEFRVEQSKFVVPFYRVKVASKNKNTFYMIYENRIICISKNGFTIGNARDFCSFIRERVKFK